MKEKNSGKKEATKENENVSNFGALGAIIFLILWIPIIYGLVLLDNNLNNRSSMTEEKTNPCVKYKTIIYATSVNPGKTICLKRVSDLKFEQFPSIEGPTIKAAPKQNTISMIP